MNRLQYETSPYLIQHAHNPVDWYPWGEAAFEKACVENKLVLVSIGYAACHWCHVMERESFESVGVAAYMNEHFVNVKVDREEHPDIDAFYMDALQAMSGQGGWPLNMFVTPDKKPVYGGTYFPPQRMYNRASWSDVLQFLNNNWRNKPSELLHQAIHITEHLERISTQVDNGKRLPLSPMLFESITNTIKQLADEINGGFTMAPKFPGSMTINYLLNYSQLEEDKDAEAIALLSLDKMLEGGIYDQLKGGFSRYATDNEWLVPHFEKMLYDNALLMESILLAYQITKKEYYKDKLYQTIDWLKSELGIHQGKEGFYAALDADSEGVEGKFYTWTYAEIMSLIPDLHPAVKAYWDITELGNWEDVIILNETDNIENIALRFDISKNDLIQWIAEAKTTLLDTRSKRIRPATDTKVLLSWNAMVNKSLSQIASVMKDESLYDLSKKHLDYLIDNFWISEMKYLKHALKKDVSLNNIANLDDYATLMQALLTIGAYSGEAKYYQLCVVLLEQTMTYFYDKKSHFFFNSDIRNEDIIVRKYNLYDGATPAANAIMYDVINKMSILYDRKDLEQIATEMEAVMTDKIMYYPTSHSLWANYFYKKMKGINNLFIIEVENESRTLLRHSMMHPFLVNVYRIKAAVVKSVPYTNHMTVIDNRPTYYLCTSKSCKSPTVNIEEIKNTIF